MSKIRVNQLETLDGTNTVDVAGIVDNVNTAEVTTSTGTQPLSEALDDRANKVALPLNVKDFGAVGDGVAADAAAIQAALDSAVSSGRQVYIPAGTYNMESTSLVINETVTVIGDNRLKTKLVWDSTLAGAAVQLASTASVQGASLSRMTLSGNLGGNSVGLKTGTSVSVFCVDCLFKDIRIEGFDLNLDIQYSWDCSFEQVRSQNSVKPFGIGPQANALSFTGCSFVSFSEPGTFINSEGVWFDAVDLSNFTTASEGFTLYQSDVTIGVCYFENISSVIAQVGFASETIPSSLTVLSGICGGGVFAYGNTEASIRLGELRGAYSGKIQIRPVNDISLKFLRNCSFGAHGLSRKEVQVIYELDHFKSRFDFPSSGGASLTYRNEREFRVVSQSVPGESIALSTSLDVGEQYTLVMIARSDSADLGMRFDGNSSLPFDLPATSTPLEVRYHYFVAPSSTLRLLFTGDIQFKYLALYRGAVNTQDITYPQSDDWKDTAPPTTGLWQRGDIIDSEAPSAGGKVGWVCVGAGTPGTWKGYGDIAL